MDNEIAISGTGIAGSPLPRPLSQQTTTVCSSDHPHKDEGWGTTCSKWMGRSIGFGTGAGCAFTGNTAA